MTNKKKIVWTGDDESGFVGNIDGVALYKVRTVLHDAPASQRKGKRYLYLTRRLNTRSYDGFADTSHTAEEAKAQCETDYAHNGGRAALHKTLGHALHIVQALGFRVSKPTLDDALVAVKAAGFRVSKPKPKSKTPKRQTQVGPTFVAEFADGTVTRMTVFTALEKLDWDRGQRLARQAWASRHKVPLDLDSAELTKIAPSISACRFEQDGKVLAQRNGGAAP